MVELACVEKDADIFFRLGHKGGFKKYTKPFVIDDFINLSVYAQRGKVKKVLLSQLIFIKKIPT